MFSEKQTLENEIRFLLRDIRFPGSFYYAGKGEAYSLTMPCFWIFLSFMLYTVLLLF